MGHSTRKDDNWYKFLLHCSYHDKEFLKENNIKKCDAKDCVNGLKEVIDYGVDSAWSGEYCDKCKGRGFLFHESKLHSVKTCPSCNGNGCGDCSNQGIVDWVTFIQIKARERVIN